MFLRWRKPPSLISRWRTYNRLKWLYDSMTYIIDELQTIIKIARTNIWRWPNLPNKSRKKVNTSKCLQWTIENRLPHVMSSCWYAVGKLSLLTSGSLWRIWVQTGRWKIQKNKIRRSYHMGASQKFTCCLGPLDSDLYMYNNCSGFDVGGDRNNCNCDGTGNDQACSSPRHSVTSNGRDQFRSRFGPPG